MIALRGILSSVAFLVFLVALADSANLDLNSRADFLEATKDTVFVKFYVPWCTYCKKIAPLWEELPEVLSVQIGEVDCEQGRGICKLYGVKKFPTMVLIKNGYYYTYDGKGDRKSLVAFAKGGYQDVERKPVPKGFIPDNDFEEAVSKIWEWAQDFIIPALCCTAVFAFAIGTCFGSIFEHFCLYSAPKRPTLAGSKKEK